MHRVYVEDGQCWTLASVYVQRAPLPTNPERLVVYETQRPPYAEEVCSVTPDGRRLCDFGPTHDHEMDWSSPESTSEYRQAQIRAVSGTDD